MRRVLFLWMVLATAVAAQDRSESDPQAVFDKAKADFAANNMQASADGFDRLVELRPDLAAGLWERGIALYYAARYDACIAQFESHRTVNPNDVENAAWHFLCVARSESPERAQRALLPVGFDSRVPMRQVYELYSGAPRCGASGGRRSSLGGLLRPLLCRPLRRCAWRPGDGARAHACSGRRRLPTTG